MAKNINELKELINNNSGKSNFLTNHFSTDTMLKNSIGYIMEKTNTSGKSVGVILSDAIEKFGELLIEKDGMDSIMITTIDNAIQNHISIEETQGNLGVKKKLPIFFDCVITTINGNNVMKEVFNKIAEEFSQEAQGKVFIESLKKAGIDEKTAVEVGWITLLISAVRAFMNKINTSLPEDEKLTSTVVDSNGNSVEVEVIAPSTEAHHVATTNESPEEGNESETPSPMKKYEIIISQIENGERTTVDTDFLEAVKLLLKDNDEDRAGKILKPYYGVLLENINKHYENEFKQYTERGDYEFMYDMIDGLLPNGDRPIEIQNAVKFVTASFMAKEFCGDMDENPDNFCKDYVKSAALLFTIIKPYIGTNEDIARFFKLCIDMQNYQTNIKTKEILEEMSDISSKINFTGNGRNYHAMRASRSEFWLKKGIKLLKTA